MNDITEIVDTADKSMDLISRILEANPSYRAYKLFLSDVENNPNLTTLDKMAFSYKSKAFIRETKNLSKIYTLADYMTKSNENAIENSIPELQEDWFAYFNDIVKNISDSEMQTVWAKILATECETPGAISKRLLSIMQVMDKHTAELFIVNDIKF